MLRPERRLISEPVERTELCMQVVVPELRWSQWVRKKSGLRVAKKLGCFIGNMVTLGESYQLRVMWDKY